MRQAKQTAVKRECRQCGATLLGKYAAKNHFCRPMAETRDEGLAKQRRSS